MTFIRKIELARQIEEMRALISENRTALPARVRQRAISQSLCDERLARQAGILATLEFCQRHEGAFRDFIRAKGAAKP